MLNYKRVYTAKLLSTLLLVVVLVLPVASTYAENSNAGRYDPLQTEEINYAISKFESMNRNDSTERIRRSTSNLQQPIVQETFDREAPLKLLVERRPREKNANSFQRLANVYYYDYSKDELIHAIVDVNSGNLIRQDRLKNSQLPLITVEVEYALNIIMATPLYRNALYREYKRVTGNQLNHISELNYKAFVFLADTLKNHLNNASKNCGLRRCAQLLIYTKDNTSLDFSPIVDLSRGVVTQFLDGNNFANSLQNDLPTFPSLH